MVSNSELAKRILSQLSKNQTDLQTMDMPAVLSSTEDERLRAKEGNEAIYPSEYHNRRLIDLSHKLMSIDTRTYNVDSVTANKLIEYIERNEDTVLEELENEYTDLVKKFYKNLQAAKKVTPEQYATEEDYKRVMNYIGKKAKEYENRLTYIYKVIETLREHMNSEDPEEYEAPKKKFQEDFDFSYLNTFWAQGNPANYSTGLNG